MPDRVGLWVHGRGDALSISLGVTDRPGPLNTELLGWWIIPIGLVVGAVLVLLTWRLGLAGVRVLGRKGPGLEARR
jgi:hypothetical protein